MLESDPFRAILLEVGAIREMEKLIVMLGEQRFGPLSDDAQKELCAPYVLYDLEQLEQLCVRIAHVSSWAELLQGR